VTQITFKCLLVINCKKDMLFQENWQEFQGA